MPRCTAHTSAYLRIDLGVQLFGCESERASIYLSDSLLYDYVLPDLIGDIDRLLESLADSLRERLDMDVTTFDPLSVYLVQDMEELEPIKSYFNTTTGAQGWHDCCGDRPGIYGATNGSPMELVAHEFIHYAIYNQYNAAVPRWLNEGLARYYELEFGPVVSTESVFFSASEAQLAAKKGSYSRSATWNPTGVEKGLLFSCSMPRRTWQRDTLSKNMGIQRLREY